MKRSGKYLLVFLLASMFAAQGCRGKKSNQEGVKCAFCKMMVKLPENDQGAKIVFKDGSEEYYCVMGHAMMGWKIETGEEADPENPPVGFYVVDYNRKQLIDALAAWYVFGSDIKARMFKKSVLAFENKADAEAFAKAHGGEVMDFPGISKQNLTELKEK